VLACDFKSLLAKGLEMRRSPLPLCVFVCAWMALYLSGLVFFAHGQSITSFTPADKFDIPVNNGSVSFGVNGTYEKAILENGVWSFADLRLNTTQSSVTGHLKISSENSMVTVMSCQIYNSTFAGEPVKGARLRCSVVGEGTQVFDLGLDPKGGDWNVVHNGVYIGKNNGWSLSPDGTLELNGLTGNVSLSYYGFPSSYVAEADYFDETFLNRHSVVIITTFAVVIIVLLAVAVRPRRKQLKLHEIKQVNNLE